MFIREKRHECGTDYLEIDIVPRTDNGERAARGVRKKKKKVSRPAQTNLNDKNSKRYMVQLSNGNFGESDLAVHLSYDPKYLPKGVEDAEKEVRNYLRRVAYQRKKQGLEELKYILVTQYSVDDNGEFSTRLHHHLIMNGGLDRDLVEEAWSKKLKGKKKESMGWCNTRRLQLNENGLEGITKYMARDPQGKKRWSSSRNLKRPTIRKNDYRYRARQIEKLAKSNDYGKEYFEKQYPNHFVVSVKRYYSDYSGWHLYIKLWRKPKNKGHSYYEDFETILSEIYEEM